MTEIINKVAQSGIVTLDLEELYTPGERVVIDIKDHLFQGLVLREKDFREFVKSEDWSKYQGKLVAIACSADAIVQTWAYMLLTVSLAPFAKKVVFGDLLKLEEVLFSEEIKKLNLSDYNDTRVVVKGCGKIQVPKSAYVEITTLLTPIAKSIMYGEPCSTVPLYKKK